MSYRPLDRPVQFVKGVGPRRAEALQRMGILTARDLLYHVPRRYEDASTVTPARQLRAGSEATVVGRVVSTAVLPTRRGLRIFQAVLRDRSGMVECAWPGQPFLERTIREGDLLLATGPVRFYHGLQLQPREHVLLARRDEKVEGGEGAVIPIYGATEGLSQRQLRQLVSLSLPTLLDEVREEDPLHAELRERLRLPPLAEALRRLHAPATIHEPEGGRRRLAFDELFAVQLLYARRAAQHDRERPGIPFERRNTLVGACFRALPFALTGAQQRVLGEIGRDMGSERRMNRLLQGDVGSGKTVVALLAMLRAVENGYQAALMAPTEILAEQHHRTLRALLGDLPVRVELLTGRLPAARAREVRGRVEEGAAQIVVGTHALIQEGVQFARLGLAVVDEQHRFGVRQRMQLTRLGENPDVLVMSATPIPRSLALTLYGDLEVSVLDELPPGRRPIRTVLRPASQRDAVLGFVRQQVEAGRQAYLVYPLVEESEKLALRSAQEEFAALGETELRGLRLALLHGQLPSEQKERVMRSFLAGEVDVLVATTVIEVGVDVANATVMVIEHPERYGLSQLHQLRGRVGRGEHESWCILLAPRGQARERLKLFASTEDGFRIARYDLQLRGQGELFGARQTGLPELRFADLERDEELLLRAREEARALIADDPQLGGHPALREALEERYAERERMFEVG
jgi:ATP-dependent DNA helicase RecG